MNDLEHIKKNAGLDEGRNLTTVTFDHDVVLLIKQIIVEEQWYGATKLEDVSEKTVAEYIQTRIYDIAHEEAPNQKNNVNTPGYTTGGRNFVQTSR